MQLGKRAYELIAEELKKHIESEVFRPGDKLATIDDLSKRYHVGRSTIREALGLLKAQGLVQTVQGGGTYVASNSVHSFETQTQTRLTHARELKELLQVRKILEVGSITLAAEARADSDLVQMKGVLHQMRIAIGNEEMSQLHDVNFHLAIAHATKNPLLERIMQGLSDAMTRTMRDSRKLWLYSEAGSAECLFGEHQSMFEAIANRDAVAAANTMRAHLSRVEDAFSIPERVD